MLEYINVTKWHMPRSCFDPIAAVCDELVTPANGNVTLSTNNTVTTASFLCSEGYTLSGSDGVTCLYDGTWSDDVPTCGNCFSFLFMKKNNHHKFNLQNTCYLNTSWKHYILYRHVCRHVTLKQVHTYIYIYDKLVPCHLRPCRLLKVLWLNVKYIASRWITVVFQKVNDITNV